MHEQRVLSAPAQEVVRTEGAEQLDARFRAQIQANLAGAYRLAGVILGEASEAEDATHDAVEHAWRSRSQLRDPDRFDAWFQRILVNSCRDRVRRRRSRPVLATFNFGVEEITTPDDPYAQAAERDAIGRALGRIDIDQRIVIALRFYLDLEIDEIARRIDVPAGTVKSRLHRGIRELRNSWEASR